MDKVINKIKETFNKIIKNENVQAFGFIFLVCLVIFSIRAIGNDFTLPMTGDYALQTYAFYSQGYHIFWDFIKTGEYPLFDFSNYLGANYLGTQSFYYVFSPLFYLLCLCPEPLLYQGIFFHLVFKFALGGFFMYLLLKKYFHVSYKISILGGIIYAMSGWALYYLWFHFGDVMAFFPLFIMGIERVLKERKGGLLTAATALCALANYFFIVNFIIFGVFYAIYRWIYIYGINKKRGYSASERYGVLFQGIIHVLCGVLIAGVCLFPSLHVATSTNRNQTSSTYVLQLLAAFFENPERVDNKLVLGEFKTVKDFFSLENLKSLFSTMFVWEDRKIGTMEIAKDVNIGYLLHNWIFMNTNCWDTMLFDNASLDNSIGGMFITTPLTMLLIPSIINVFKSKRPWAIFGVILCLTLPFFPITAHAAFAFTSLYGRWQIWIVMIGIIFIIPTLDNFEKVDKRFVTVNLLFNYLLAAIVYVIASNNEKFPTTYPINIFGLEIPGLILLSIAELLIMAIVWFVYRYKKFTPDLVKKIMCCIVIIEIGISCVVTVEHKGYYDWDTYYLSQPEYQELTKVVEDIKAENPEEFYRIMNTEATRSTMNMPAALNYSGASSFNSTYAFSLDEFKNRSRMAYGGGWTMGNHEKRYWLDQYISTKYYIIDKKDPNNDNALYSGDNTQIFDGRTSMEENQQEYRLNLSWNYQLIKEYEHYDVYENTKYNGIGYVVDTYYPSSSVGSSKLPTFYEELYSSAAIIESENVEDFRKIESDVKETTRYVTTYKEFKQSKWDLYFSPREDMSRHLTGNNERQTYKLEGSSFDKDEISSYLPENSQFLHERWVDKKYFGDQLILKLKEGTSPLASEATDANLCYINVYFKLGPKVLISFYNGDTLVTQDAHSHSNSSLNAENYEWKLQRGFYLDQPVDKIVIEFVDDTPYEKLFNGNSVRNINITYSYQKDIEEMQSKIDSTIFKNVKYTNNKFTFDGQSEQKLLAVTSIPFDEGWTLKANGKEKEIFLVNGGFVGFITEVGETNYELSYFTPNLKLGLTSSFVGLLMWVALAFIYGRSKIDILKCEEQMASGIIIDKKRVKEKFQSKYQNKNKEKINALLKEKTSYDEETINKTAECISNVINSQTIETNNVNEDDEQIEINIVD